MSPRERRLLASMAVSIVLTGIYYYWTSSNDAPAVVAATAADSVAGSEARLARLRDTAATVPGKDAILKDVRSQLALREKGLIQAPTVAQAQAQMVQIVRSVLEAENPPISIRAQELGSIAPLGDAYGVTSVALQIECHVEQLVNVLAGLSARPELIYTDDIRVTSANNPKEKLLGVRLAVAGVVPRALVPRNLLPAAAKTAAAGKGAATK
jgi:hypothetical protein